MQLNYLALAIPFFVFFMLAEYLWSRYRGKQYYNFTNSITNINVGIAERLADVLIYGAFYFVYDYVYKYYALFHFNPTIFHWVGLLLLTDFIWYWYHRLAHEINLLWMVHIVHHQSEDFNYTVSARITVFQAIVRTGFWALLPLLGFTAPMITTMLLIHGLYPFFVHTRMIGKLGWIEYVFVTPSHHRVHHACNEQYLDKNYGDVLIIWDKIFGTFCVEEEEPVYGLTKPLKSHSFLWQHFHFALELAYNFKKANTWQKKLGILFGKPDLLLPDTRKILERKWHIHQPTREVTPKLNRYVVWQIGAIIFLLFAFILFEKQLPVKVQVLSAGFILITLVNCGAILEQRKWIFYLEFCRFLLCLLLLVVFVPYVKFILVIIMVIGLLLYYFRYLQQQYLQLVYKNFQ